MIGQIRGILRRKSLPVVLVDVGGVGYELRLSLSTFEALPKEGEAVCLEVVTLWRSESLELFGFGAAQEKAMFSALLGVNGVGPRIALSLLSTLPVDDVAAAVNGEHPAALERVPGVGRKTAQRIVLELKDKLKTWTPGAAAAPAPVAAGDLRADAVLALENLGYRRAQAEKAVDAAQRASGDADLATVLRGALRALGSE